MLQEVNQEVKIPLQLQDDRIKFCRVEYQKKKPFEKDWTNKPYSHQDIIKFLPNENYGVLCGYGNLAVIDSDNKDFQLAVEALFPKTFRVKTGSGGVHNYFFIPDLKQKIILNLDDEYKTHLGEVQSWGTQVVAPNSIHPNGNRYEVLEDSQIETVSCEMLFNNLKPFMKKEIETVEANAVWENMRTPSDIDSLSVTSIWGTVGMKKLKDEYYGCHPIHGSTGGMNFWINPSKNLWKCFRCNSGGGALSAIAVKEGIIDCSEAQKGNLRGENAYKCIEIAKQKYGLPSPSEGFTDISNDPNKIKANFQPQVCEIQCILDKDLKNYTEEEKSWIIEKLIPTKAVCILTGKRGTMKTFVSLLMTYSIAFGNDFLHYQTEKGKVVYLDKENGLGIMKQRTSMLKRGMSLDDTENVAFICFSQLKLDKLGDICAIEKVIEDYKPNLLIVDTYRRAVGYDENDAGEVSKLFVDTLRPIVEKYNMSILLIHHNRKSSKSNGNNGDEDSGGDEMDELRGSSDLANYADIILKIERKSERSLLLKQLKNRNAREEKPIQISCEFDGEDSVKLKYEGEFIPKSSAQRCAELLILWFSKNRIKHFKTKEAEEIAFRSGIKERNFAYGIKELQDRGIIEKTTKGEFDVKIN